MHTTPETAKPERFSPIIYLCAAAATGGYLLSSHIYAMTHTELWLRFLLSWSVSFGVPSLFAFAYPRYVFELSSGKKTKIRALVVNIAGFVSAFLAFSWFVSPYPEAHQIRQDLGMAFSLTTFVILLILFVSALFLLVRRRSSLAFPAAILIWPCLLFFAMAFSIPYWGPVVDSPILFFLCFCSCFLLSFAAGAIRLSQSLAHAAALVAGLLALPWPYREELLYLRFQNAWILLNVPDTEAGRIPVHLIAISEILAVALLVSSIILAIVRLVPAHYQIAGSSLRGWNWPAVAVSLMVLFVWFAKSVTPYRIPGVVDQFGPMLKILHVEKRGLQFHETCLRLERDSRFSITHKRPSAPPIRLHGNDGHRRSL